MTINIGTTEFVSFFVAMISYFGLTIYFTFKYINRYKEIEQKIDKIMLNAANYIAKELNKHKEEQLLEQKKLQKLIKY